MRVRLFAVIFTKRYFLICGYNSKPNIETMSKGSFSFSHLPEDKIIRDLFLDSISKVCLLLKEEGNGNV